MTEERFYRLFEEYATDLMNKEDRKEFLSLLEDPYYRGLMEKVMEEEWNTGKYEERENEEIGQLIDRNVLEVIGGAKVVSMKTRLARPMRMVRAAAVLLVLFVGAYYVISRNSAKKNEPLGDQRGLVNAVKPGSHQAILTLSNGQNILLDSIANGTVAHQGGTRLEEKQGGFLDCESDGRNDKMLFNVVSTPKGGQYRVRLTDGTDVWLNSASTLRFPIVFAAGERTVQITGEAYFEVAHNAGKPFRVEVKGMKVEVLGTRFNIDAYEDEGLLKTTLAQGKVKVLSGQQSAILSAGQQARINIAKELKVIKGAVIEEALAWKNGYFVFKDTRIETVMKQIGRWYNVEIIYAGVIPQGHYKGVIARNVTAAKMIQVFNASGIRCRLEGRTIVVLPE
jgi:hypothetical protein